MVATKWRNMVPAATGPKPPLIFLSAIEVRHRTECSRCYPELHHYKSWERISEDSPRKNSSLNRLNPASEKIVNHLICQLVLIDLMA